MKATSKSVRWLAAGSIVAAVFPMLAAIAFYVFAPTRFELTEAGRTVGAGLDVLLWTGPIVAMVCGIQVLRRAGTGTGPRSCAITGMLLGCFFLLAGGILPVATGARERARRVSCMSNLKQIGLGFRMYSADHGESFPTNFSQLAPYVGSNGVVLFRCPSDPWRSGPVPELVTHMDGWPDYTLVQGLMESNNPSTLLVYCIPEHHQGAGANVLFVDGHVEWLKTADFIALTNDPAGFATNRWQRSDWR